MIKHITAAALLTAGLAIAPAAQARIAFNGVAAGMTIIPAAHGRIAFNGVKAGTAKATATTVQVVYVQLPRR